jgi:hypothetical protein
MAGFIFASFSSSIPAAGVCLAVLLALASSVAAATPATAPAAEAFVAAVTREPVRFAAGAALATPPPVAVANGSWPALVPDCTAAYLNVSGVAAVVRIAVPAGRAVSLRGCSTAAPMPRVRLVLAMGRSSAVALDAWNVEVGGVTIEGPAGNASHIIDALVVVRGGSRIVASASARSASNSAEDDVHAMSAVAPAAGGGNLSVSGLGIVVMEGSVVSAAHEGTGVLYASACAVRAEAAAVPGATGPATLTVQRLRVVVTGGSRVEASATRTGAVYYGNARRAHAATIQVLPGARLEASWVAVTVLDGSTAAASGDDSSSAGGIGVNSRERRSYSTFVPTTANVSHATLVAAGPNTAIRVTTKGGNGASTLGVAAHGRGATASMTNVTLYAAGPTRPSPCTSRAAAAAAAVEHRRWASLPPTTRQPP